MQKVSDKITGSVFDAGIHFAGAFIESHRQIITTKEFIEYTYLNLRFLCCIIITMYGHRILL